jgi:hypothetical protein
MKRRIVWGIFIILGFIVLIMDTPLNWKYGLNVIKELRELMKFHSKYAEDGDWTLILKKKKWGRK